MRTCKYCKRELPEGSFSVYRKPYGRQLYRSYRCNSCKVDQNRARREAKGITKIPHRLSRPHLDVFGVTVKRCSKCHSVKSVADFRWSEGKPKPHCKDCALALEAADRAANPIKYRQKVKDWQTRNPEYILAQRQKHREWCKANPEEAKRRKHERYLKDREYNLEYQKRYKENATPERLRRLKEQTRKSHLTDTARRRAQKDAAMVPINREDIIKRDGPSCYICGKILDPASTRIQNRITLDHVTPLVRGGSHTADNLRIACHSCNSKKGYKTLDEFHRLYQIMPLVS